eukprot:COSAG01_NODE_7716_length_3086_cov_5.125544_4_plen_85_part_00
MQHVSVRRCTVRRHEGTRRGRGSHARMALEAVCAGGRCTVSFCRQEHHLTLENPGQKKLRRNWGGGEGKGRSPSESVSVAGHSR